MGEKIRLSKEEMEGIVYKRNVFHSPISELSVMYNRSDTTISACLKAFDLVRDAAWEEAAHAIGEKSIPNYMLQWAAEYLNAIVPDAVNEAYKRTLEKQRAERAALKKPQNETAPIKQDNDKLYFIKILEALIKQNELLESLIDVVIPKYVCDLKDNLNVNTDILSEHSKKQSNLLEAIKVNTRKRGQ